MEQKQIIRNWILKAKKDIQTAKDLFRLGHYNWCLFIWHLALEKVLKAKLIAGDLPVMYTHDLTRLARKANIALSDKQIRELNEITTFNIEARYDDYKLSFYQKATKKYATLWTKICEAFYQLFKKGL